MMGYYSQEGNSTGRALWFLAKEAYDGRRKMYPDSYRDGRCCIPINTHESR